MERPFTVESFGSDCPENWEEICKFLNNVYELVMKSYGGFWTEEIWEKYCLG